MCEQERGLKTVEDGCGCGSCPDREERGDRTEEIDRLKERKYSLEREIAEVERKMKDLKA